MLVKPPIGYIQNEAIGDYYSSLKERVCVDTQVYNDQDVHVYTWATDWKAYSIAEYGRIKVFLEAL